jgi:hypothetical protein
MGSIPLVALNVKPVEQPDILGNYQRLAQLKGMQQQQQQSAAMAPYQQQVAQNTAAQSSVDLQNAQQAQKDQQTIRTAMGQLIPQGKTLGDVADVLASQQAISPASWKQLKDADVEQRKTLQTMTTNQFDNATKSLGANKQLFESAMSMTDEQIRQNWSQIAQQYNAIPGNEKRPLDPNQPLTKDQIAQQGTMLQLHQTYLDDVAARREKEVAAQTAETDLQTKLQNQSYGPTGQAADAKYTFLQAKKVGNQPISDADQAWMVGYEKQKKLLKPASASGAGGGADVPLIDPDKQPNRFKEAQDLAYGKMTNATFRTLFAYSRDPNLKLSMYATAQNLNPNFNPAAFEMGLNFAKNPKIQQQLSSLDNVIRAAPDLLKLSDDASRSGITTLNKLIEKGGITIGKKQYSNFHTGQIAFADELSGALGYGSATDMSREMGFNMTDEKLTPEQFSSGIKDVVLPFIDRKRKTMLDQMGIYGQEGMNPAASAPRGNSGGAPQPSGGQSFKLTATAPNGHKIGSNDGGNTWVDVQTGQKVQ